MPCKRLYPEPSCFLEEAAEHGWWEEASFIPLWAADWFLNMGRGELSRKASPILYHKESITPSTGCKQNVYLPSTHTLESFLLWFLLFFILVSLWDHFQVDFIYIKTDVGGRGGEDGNLSLRLRPAPGTRPLSPQNTKYLHSCGLHTSFISYTSTLVHFHWLWILQMALFSGNLHVPHGQV